MKDPHQPGLPGFEPSRNIARRRPRRKKGETWQAYCVRYMTWYYQYWTPERLAVSVQTGAAWQRSREKLAESAKAHHAAMLERAKANPLPNAIWFWFGPDGITHPSAAVAQYINLAQLQFLIKKAKVRGIPPPNLTESPQKWPRT